MVAELTALPEMKECQLDLKVETLAVSTWACQEIEFRKADTSWAAVALPQSTSARRPCLKVTRPPPNQTARSGNPRPLLSLFPPDSHSRLPCPRSRPASRPDSRRCPALRSGRRSGHLLRSCRAPGRPRT